MRPAPPAHRSCRRPEVHEGRGRSGIGPFRSGSAMMTTVRQVRSLRCRSGRQENEKSARNALPP